VHACELEDQVVRKKILKRSEIGGIKCFSIHNLDLINYIKINLTLAKGCKDLAVSEGHDFASGICLLG
jgi:hypothetical protein